MALVDSNEILKNIDEWLDTVGYCTIGKGLSYYAELCGCIEDTTSVDAAPVVHAYWQEVQEQAYFRKHYHKVACSNCHKEGTTLYNYCPNCGARMDENANDIN